MKHSAIRGQSSLHIIFHKGVKCDVEPLRDRGLRSPFPIFRPAISRMPITFRFVDVMNTSSAAYRSSIRSVCSTTDVPASAATSVSTPRVTPSRHPRVQRRRQHFIAFHRENICRCAFAYFAAFVQQDYFVKTFALRLGHRPNAVQPRMVFTPASGEAAWPAMLAHRGRAAFRDSPAHPRW